MYHNNPAMKQRKPMRRKGYDYAQAGMYFVTICTKDRACLFGQVVNWKMILNNAGKIAHQEWLKTTMLRENLKLGAFVVMPNHIHGIIIITHRDVSHTSENTSDTSNKNMDKYNKMNMSYPKDVSHTSENVPGISNKNRDVCNTSLRSPSKTIGAIVRGYKSSVTKQINALHHSDDSVWQGNYHERIIQNEQSLHRISKYIIDNPEKWELSKK